MAATYRATAQAVAFASAKSMIAIYNADGSFTTLKAYRLFQFNNGTSAVTGVLCTMKVNRITTSLASGTTITPVLHDTTSTALGAHVTSQTNGTVGARTDLFRQYIWSNDEPSVSGATMDEWELLVPFATIFDSGYGDSNVEPITCRNTQGVEIQQSSSSAVGTNDFEIEFTAV